MNGYERIRAALGGSEPDTTPIMLHNFMMAAREYGVTMGQFRESPKIIAGAFIAAIENYRYDGVLVDMDTVTLAGAVGVPVDFPQDDPARTDRGCLGSMEDVHRLKPARVEDYRYIQVWLEAVRLLKEHFKDEVYVRGNCDQAPFSLASMMRGMQNWMVDLMTGPEEEVHAVLEYCTDASLQFIRLMAQTGCDMVSNGDSPAGPELISPEMYVRYALPYEKRLVAAAHEAGTAYALHICGNTNVILGRMLDTGADAFDLDYKTDIVKIRDAFGDSAALIGTIDPSEVLALGTPETVRHKTLELLTTYDRSHRFILNSGCAIPPTTPSENIRAMIDAARTYRRSPRRSLPTAQRP